MSSNTIQILSISTALVGAGGIATLSLFDVPMLQSQPASRSLPLTRWLFSRGSHIFPSVAVISSTGFAYLAYDALPPSDRSASALLRHIGTSGKAGLYLTAAALTFSIAPFTQLVMTPTNFTLIKRNEEKGGSRSAESAKQNSGRVRSVKESIEGKDDVNQFRDVSGPQEKTRDDSDSQEDGEIRELLSRFGKMNSVRAVLMGLGGLVGLAAALA